MSPADLSTLRVRARSYHRRVAAIDAERVELYRLIREARAAGVSLRAIAEASGLTFGRISQICA